MSKFDRFKDNPGDGVARHETDPKDQNPSSKPGKARGKTIGIPQPKQEPGPLPTPTTPRPPPKKEH